MPWIFFQYRSKHFGHFLFLILNLLNISEKGFDSESGWSSDGGEGISWLVTLLLTALVMDAVEDTYLRGTETRDLEMSEPSSLMVTTEAGTRTG